MAVERYPIRFDHTVVRARAWPGHPRATAAICQAARGWPGQAHGCPVKLREQRSAGLAYRQNHKNPLARACPGHPRLWMGAASACIDAWMAGSSPAKGYLRLKVRTTPQPDLLNRTAVGLSRPSTSFVQQE